ncbi:hypothetical protein ACIRS1_25470 [Kitasatospora sp. NPDC101176]|uniref:hypothetical protein n=1 Tax=Kitasatospora sp. NPDC101176 TaxID=3364099 RepID=UPI00381077E0
MASGTEIVLTPGNVLRQVDAGELRERAWTAFSRRIAALQWSGVPDDWDPQEFLDQIPHGAPLEEILAEGAPATVLSLHIETLAGVLIDNPLHDNLDPQEVLLYHEEKYWDRASATLFQQPLDPDYRKTLVAVQRMTGAADQKEADAAIRTAWAVYHGDDPMAPLLTPDMVRAQRRFLTTVYPPTGHAYWGGVGPDALTARLINDVEAEGCGEPEDGTFITQTLTHPRMSPAQRRHCLTIVGRCISSYPALATAASQAVAANPNLLWDDAQDLLEKLPGPTRDRWRNALASAQRRHDEVTLSATQVVTDDEPDRPDLPVVDLNH